MPYISFRDCKLLSNCCQIRNFFTIYQDEWEKKISAELEELEVEYCNRIKTLGEGHRSVHEVNMKEVYS